MDKSKRRVGEEDGDKDGDSLKKWPWWYWRRNGFIREIETLWDSWSDLALVVTLFFSFGNQITTSTQHVCLKWRTMSPVFKSSSDELLSMTFLCILKFETREWCGSSNDDVVDDRYQQEYSMHARSRAHTRLLFLRGPLLTQYKLYHRGTAATCCLRVRALTAAVACRRTIFSLVSQPWI